MLSVGRTLGPVQAGQQALHHRRLDRGQARHAQPAVAGQDAHHCDLWVQDAWSSCPALTLTLGGRYEWWRAYDGRNYLADAAAISAIQPERRADGFSPKASLDWTVAPEWTARLSLRPGLALPDRRRTLSDRDDAGRRRAQSRPASRTRTVAGTGGRAHDAHGVRVSLFNEVIDDALISQTGPLQRHGDARDLCPERRSHPRAGCGSGVRPRATCCPRFDLSGSVTYADAETRATPRCPRRSASDCPPSRAGKRPRLRPGGRSMASR